MKMLKVTSALLLATAMLVSVAGTAMADTGTASPSASPTKSAAKPKETATPTPTPTPEVVTVKKTRVECTSGSYGQQTCKTVEYEEKIVKQIDHKPAKTGLAENVLFGLMAMLGISSAGYVVTRKA